MIEFNDLRKRLEILLIGILVGIACIYGGFRAYPLLAGPRITIIAPQDGDFVASTTFTISGNVLRANDITLQGKHITIDDQGNFSETLVASLPYTILVLVAKDAYGATETKTLRVIPQ